MAVERIAAFHGDECDLGCVDALRDEVGDGNEGVVVEGGSIAAVLADGARLLACGGDGVARAGDWIAEASFLAGVPARGDGASKKVEAVNERRDGGHATTLA